MRIVVAEDGALFREGLIVLLERHGNEVVAAVDNADDLVEVAQKTEPDIAIIDIRMPSDTGLDGAGAAIALRPLLPDCGLLILSQHVELRGCRELIGTPSFGYLLKDTVLDVDEFIQALERVAIGGTALDPIVVRSLVQSSSRRGLDALTTRELQVLGLVAQGLSNAAVAADLNLSERTVETHMRTIFTKLDLHDDHASHRRVQAVVTYLGQQQPI